MDLTPRHTRIVEVIETAFGTLVREDHCGYPGHESNLYLLDNKNNPIWFAERVLEGDCYPNPTEHKKTDKIKCFSARGVECEIDLNSGRVLNADLAR